MHALQEKPKILHVLICMQACKCYHLMSLIWHRSCKDCINKLANYFLQQFLHYFILF